MNQIREPRANAMDFGHTFNYSVWTPNTRVTLCRVPWGNDYRDVVKFENQNALDAYLSSTAGPLVTVQNVTYARVGSPVRLDIPFNTAYTYNYLRVENGGMPITGDPGPRTFYYFILDVRMVAPNTTEFVIQLDVFQTFINFVQFGRAFVERGHIGIAQYSADYAENWPWMFEQYYLTQPEGLDCGSDYGVNAIYNSVIATVGTPIVEPSDEPSTSNYGYAVVVASNIALDKPWAKSDASPTFELAQGTRSMDGLPNACDFYVFDNDTWNQLRAALAQYPWISQGITGIWIVPLDAVNTYEAADVTIDTPSTIDLHGKRLQKVNNVTRTVKMGRRSFRTDNVLPDRYKALRKFTVYPYTVVELTTYSGTPLVMKPERIASHDLAAVQLAHIEYPGPRLAYAPLSYNTGNAAGVSGYYRDGGEWLDYTTGIFNLPSFAVINNSFAAFMASNRNSIAYQHSSADWSQQKALAGNTLAYSQSTKAIDTANEMNALDIGQRNAQLHVSNNAAIQSAGVGMATSLVGGAMGGNPMSLASGIVGAAASGANAAISINAANQNVGIQNLSGTMRTEVATGQMGFNRDTNKQYADFAAQGDYANQLAAINAKVQDAQLLQPTTAGQVGGDAFNLAVYRWALTWKVKRINGAAMRAIGEYWLRYGYAVNAFVQMPASLMTCQRMTYWKLRECYLRSAGCPEPFKQTIRGIFEKGVTVYHDPADIGTRDFADNAPLYGEWY